MKEKLQLNIRTYLRGLILIGIVVGFASCQDKDEFIPDPVTGNVEQFYGNAQSAQDYDTFNATEDHVFITNNNTSVHIPANSLVNADGLEAAGNVTVGFEEVLNKGELIVHNVPTTTAEKVLSSEGAFHIAFADVNEQLFIKPGSLITIRVTDPNANSNAKLFDGFGAPFSDVWEESDENMELEAWSFFWDGKDWIDSGYEVYITESGWYNVALELDAAMSYTEPICVNLPIELYDGTNSDVFLVLDDYDTVVPLEMDSEKMLFCASFSNMPLGVEATIVSISSLGEENYHFGTSTATISVDNGEIFVFPKPKTKEEILDALAAL